MNFVMTDVPVGVQEIEMQVSATALRAEQDANCADTTGCNANVTVMIHQATLTVEQAQFVKDDITVVEF